MGHIILAWSKSFLYPHHETVHLILSVLNRHNSLGITIVLSAVDVGECDTIFNRRFFLVCLLVLKSAMADLSQIIYIYTTTKTYLTAIDAAAAWLSVG
jgi:hypothetical protein